MFGLLVRKEERYEGRVSLSGFTKFQAHDRLGWQGAKMEKRMYLGIKGQKPI